MGRKIFEWDDPTDPDGNVVHIAAHDVTTDEAESVVRNGKNPVTRSGSSTYPITFGRTKTGKYLAVIWFARGDNPEIIRVLTAYPVNPPKRR